MPLALYTNTSVDVRRDRPLGCAAVALPAAAAVLRDVRPLAVQTQTDGFVVECLLRMLCHIHVTDKHIEMN